MTLMKKTTPSQTILVQLLVLLFASNMIAAPIPEPVTYQGRLDDNGSPANGLFELRVGVHDTNVGGAILDLLTNNVTVSNGLFTTVLQLNSASITAGSLRWLELGVRTNGSVSAFTTLSPRQQLTYTPYALRATTADFARDLPQGLITDYNIADDSITAVKIEANQVVKSVNSLRDNVTLTAGSGITITPLGNTLTIADSNADWKLTGNSASPGQFLGTINNQPLELRVNNQRGLRIESNTNGAPNVIAGSPVNFVLAGVVGSTIAGGGALNYEGAPYTNSVSSDLAVIGGGLNNGIGSESRGSTIGGGLANNIATNSSASTIAGGDINIIGTNSAFSTIGGGKQNGIDGDSIYATIAGGYNNHIRPGSPFSKIGGGASNQIGTNSPRSVIGGGHVNFITPNAPYATIPGGYSNAATNHAFAAGYRANANHSGSFVWADSTEADFASTVSNQFRVRANGGMQVVGSTAQPALHFTGARIGGLSTPVGLAENTQITGQSAPALRVSNAGGNAIDGALSVSANGTGFIATFGNASTIVSRLATNGTWTALAFNPTSDRNAKEHFQPIDAREILEKVSAMELTRWNYKAAPGVEHIGPMAQDFQAAFGLGTDDKHIATVDADGVALAAIQGLNQKVERKNAEIDELKREVEILKQTVAELVRSKE